MWLIVAILFFCAWALCFMIFKITFWAIHIVLVVGCIALILHFATGGEP